MNEIIQVQKKIIPEAFTMLEERYEILRNIGMLEPIGRRALANRLQIGERIVRSEVEFLKKQGLIDVNAAGMMITSQGEKIIDQLKEFIFDLRGINDLQEALKKRLQIKEVYVVPGNLEADEYVLNDISNRTSRILEDLIEENSTIGVTGGTTMAAVVKHLSQQGKEKNILVVPARGGLGKKVESQANSIAATMASKLKGNYHLLHASDTLSQEALESILQDPEIKRIKEILKKVNLVIFGIGRADEMARRRELSNEVVKLLTDRGAVAEAFGYYFNKEGKIIYEMKTIGISFEDFQRVPVTIGVAGGPHKAEAIVAISRLKQDMILVTDEGAAREILKSN